MKKEKGLIVQNELLDVNRYKEQREEQDFMLMKDGADLLNISTQTLTTICALYDVEQYRLRTKFIMLRKSALMEYLDEHHFVGKEDPKDKTVIFDYRGEKNENLTYVKEKHAEIPQLYQLAEFAEKAGIGIRRVTRYCDQGILQHYRINSTYKVSQADTDRNIRILSEMQFDPSKKLALKRRKKRATKAEMEQRRKQIQ